MDDASKDRDDRDAGHASRGSDELPPSYGRFFALVREVFGRLLKDYDFSEVKASYYAYECTIRFRNTTTGLEAGWEYMGHPYVLLEQLSPGPANATMGPEVRKTYGLHDLARKKCPERLPWLRAGAAFSLPPAPLDDIDLPDPIPEWKWDDLRRILKEYLEILTRFGAEALRGRFDVLRT